MSPSDWIAQGVLLLGIVLSFVAGIFARAGSRRRLENIKLAKEVLDKIDDDDEQVATINGYIANQVKAVGRGWTLILTWAAGAIAVASFVGALWLLNIVTDT